MQWLAALTAGSLRAKKAVPTVAGTHLLCRTGYRALYGDYDEPATLNKDASLAQQQQGLTRLVPGSSHHRGQKQGITESMRSLQSACAILLLAAFVTGCASTKLTNSWRNPDYDGPVTGMVVLGVSKQASVRRVFEDEFAAQLRSQGIRAIPSHTLIPEDGPVEEERLRAAVESAGTDAVIITRLVKIESKISVTPAYPGPAYGFSPYYYGYYSGAWVGYYEPPIVREYDVVTAETTVFANGRAEPVWSGTTETFAPGELKKETAGFAKVVMDALAAEGLI